MSLITSIIDTITKEEANFFNKLGSESFNFTNSGFNLRPLDISAAIGLSQFQRLNSIIKTRTKKRVESIIA